VLTHPKKVATLYTVARWISGGPAAIVASSIITGQYSWKYASLRVDSTQTFDAMPAINKYWMPRLRSTASSGVPANPL